jgi:hypothetical protein
MARVAGLRRALAACAHSVSALQQGSSNSLRPAAISSLVETAPSTSYAAPQTGWLRRQRASNASQLSDAAAAAAATEGSAAAAQPGTALYQIVVVTGDVRGAGSPAPAVVTLVGTGASSCDNWSVCFTPCLWARMAFVGSRVAESRTATAAACCSNKACIAGSPALCRVPF